MLTLNEAKTYGEISNMFLPYMKEISEFRYYDSGEEISNLNQKVVDGEKLEINDFEITIKISN